MVHVLGEAALVEAHVGCGAGVEHIPAEHGGLGRDQPIACCLARKVLLHHLAQRRRVLLCNSVVLAGEEVRELPVHALLHFRPLVLEEPRLCRLPELPVVPTKGVAAAAGGEVGSEVGEDARDANAGDHAHRGGPPLVRLRQHHINEREQQRKLHFRDAGFAPSDICQHREDQLRAALRRQVLEQPQDEGTDGAGNDRRRIIRVPARTPLCHQRQPQRRPSHVLCAPAVESAEHSLHLLLRDSPTLQKKQVLNHLSGVRNVFHLGKACLILDSRPQP
eukprot:1772293-Rhodomonas_salina.1